MTQTDVKKKWETAQVGEFHHHFVNEWRKSGNFMGATRRLLRSFHFHPLDFKDNVILDLGAGSKLRTKFFEGAQIIAIEPLADKFMNDIEWCDLKDASRVYSKPAEDYIEELEGQVDLVFCVNVLDHVYDPMTILKNARKYLKPGGQLLLSVDLYWKTSKNHPVKFNKRKLEKMVRESGFGIIRVYMALSSKSSYGLGETYTIIARAVDNPEDEQLICLTAFGENARHLRFLAGLLTIISPYKIIRDIIVRARRKFLKTFNLKNK